MTMAYVGRVGTVRAMTPGEDVGHWNVFRWGIFDGQINIDYDNLPDDAKQWLASKHAVS